MPPTHARMLNELLSVQGRSARIFSSREELDKHFGSTPALEVNAIPVFQGLKDTAFIEIKTEDILIVKAELTRMGYAFVGDEEIPAVTEYLCPKCKFNSPAPGLCPKHGTQLVTFEQLVILLRSRAEFRTQLWIWAFILLILAIVADSVFKWGVGLDGLLKIFSARI